uniref:Uncharacterized protein n=1 Tax=Ixodes ricinus TaxID=34613 RepID=A0A6B0UP31_IXORI
MACLLPVHLFCRALGSFPLPFSRLEQHSGGLGRLTDRRVAVRTHVMSVLYASVKDMSERGAGKRSPGKKYKRKRIAALYMAANCRFTCPVWTALYRPIGSSIDLKSIRLKLLSKSDKGPS